MCKQTSDVKTALETVVSMLSLIVQMVGGFWLYSQITETEPALANLGFFSYIAGAWFVIAVLVLLHDLVICYTFFNQEGMQNKLIMVGRMNEWVKDLFFFPGAPLFFILSLPVLLYRASKDL